MPGVATSDQMLLDLIKASAVQEEILKTVLSNLEALRADTGELRDRVTRTEVALEGVFTRQTAFDRDTVDAHNERVKLREQLNSQNVQLQRIIIVVGAVASVPDILQWLGPLVEWF